MPRAKKAKAPAQTPTQTVGGGETVGGAIQPGISNRDHVPTTHANAEHTNVRPTERVRPTLIVRDANDHTCEWCNRTRPTMETVQVTVVYTSFGQQWSYDGWLHELCVLPFLKGYPDTAVMLPVSLGGETQLELG